MDLAETIISAENKYRQILEDFFLKTWSATVQSSHNIDHHRRVWHYAKELLAVATDLQIISNPVQPEKLIIACYLHDIGMSTDPGIKHGRHGSELCREFLAKNHINNTDFGEVLHAIENHDDKDYSDPSAPDPLLAILSVADDLDAFGRIGIFRYSEIYLTRGVPPNLTGYRIIENAGKRFRNFETLFGRSAAVFKKHQQRYLLLDDFFNRYNIESSRFTFGNNEPSGYRGVLEIISGMINLNIPPEMILSGRNRYSGDPVISNFLVGLSNELDEFKSGNRTL